MIRLIPLLCTFLLGIPGTPGILCQTSPDTQPLPLITFDTLEHDFGHNVSGPPLSCSFRFVNKGSAPLFIEKVKAG
ncbi:DUF1573 domain-containing protein [bacterium]|nr:DUF1573 domain-containing protein [candidate division CSSED10-310 bacterium]